MLVSAVITLQPEREGQVPGSVGRAIQTLFYGWLAGVNPGVAGQLNDSNLSKPFSISNLNEVNRLAARSPESGPEPETPPEGILRPAYRPGRLDLQKVSPEREYWFRIATYHPTLSKPLVEQILPNLPARLNLFDVPFKVRSFTTDPAEHLWAGQDNYEAISMRRMLTPAPASRITLRFASPTTFNLSGRKMPLPLPELVFGSLLQRWNNSAPMALDLETRRYATENLYPAFYRLNTHLVNFVEFRETGFVGVCEFHATTTDRYWLGSINTLADFAFYAGVGHRATMGMGQTRWLESRSRKPQNNPEK